MINILSAVTNTYQGGCPFPYLSEVGREGLNQKIFIVSTCLAVFPWVIYSMYYMETNIKYAKYVIKSTFKRRVFDLLHAIMCMMQCSSAIFFVTASVYDLIRYPEIHQSSTTLLCVIANLAYGIDNVLSFLFLKSTWSKMKYSKLFFVSLSWINIILFGTLNNVPGCSVEILPMEECFKWTSEAYCFANQNPMDPTNTLLRYYPYCHALHFIRGLCEYLCLLFGMMHFSFLRGDIVIMRYEMVKWEYLKKMKKTDSTRAIRAKPKQEDQNEELKDLNDDISRSIKETSNVYLLYYLQKYWRDYDSLHSHEMIDGIIQ